MTQPAPHRVSDPEELRVFAHPLRMRILEELSYVGPATASELGARLDESPANCSWHLRRLAKYDYVEEAPGGTGRQRPWRATTRSRTWDLSDDSEELRAAGDGAARMLYQREFEALLRWRDRRRTEPAEWQDVAGLARHMLWLTPEELAELTEDYYELLRRHSDRRLDPATRPPGARLVRVVAWAVPDRPAEEAH